MIPAEKWHRGSRFWRAFPWLCLWVSAAAGLFRSESLFVTLAALLLTAAGAKTGLDEFKKPRGVNDEP